MLVFIIRIVFLRFSLHVQRIKPELLIIIIFHLSKVVLCYSFRTIWIITTTTTTTTKEKRCKPFDIVRLSYVWEPSLTNTTGLEKIKNPPKRKIFTYYDLEVYSGTYNPITAADRSSAFLELSGINERNKIHLMYNITNVFHDCSYRLFDTQNDIVKTGFFCLFVCFNRQMNFFKKFIKKNR